MIRQNFLTTQIKKIASFILIIFSFVSLSMLTSCKSAVKEPTGESLQKEKDAILATIEKETNSFFARDYESWKSTFAHTDYALQAWSNRDGTFDASAGWDRIDKTISNYISENPVPDSAQRKVERKNIMFKFYGPNVAFLTWD